MALRFLLGFLAGYAIVSGFMFGSPGLNVSPNQGRESVFRKKELLPARHVASDRSNESRVAKASINLQQFRNSELLPYFRERREKSWESIKSEDLYIPRKGLKQSSLASFTEFERVNGRQYYQGNLRLLGGRNFTFTIGSQLPAVESDKYSNCSIHLEPQEKGGLDHSLFFEAGRDCHKSFDASREVLMMVFHVFPIDETVGKKYDFLKIEFSPHQQSSHTTAHYIDTGAWDQYPETAWKKLTAEEYQAIDADWSKALQGEASDTLHASLEQLSN